MKRSLIVILIVIFVMSAAFLTGCSGSVTWPWTVQGNTVSVRMLGTEKDISKIEINMAYGDIQIISSSSLQNKIADNEILVQISDKADVPEVEVSAEDGVLRLEESEKKGMDAAEYSIYLFVPEKMRIHSMVINNQDGDLIISGRLNIQNISVGLGEGDINIHEHMMTYSKGELFIPSFAAGADTTIKGNLCACTGSGDISIINSTIVGDADLAADKGDIMADNISCENISMKSGGGEIGFGGDVDEDLYANTVNGSIDVSNSAIEGETELIADEGDIMAENMACGNISMKSGKGEISFGGDVDEDLYADAVSGSIDVSNSAIEGGTELITDTGDIMAENMACGNISMKSGKGEILFGGEANGGLYAYAGEGSVDVSNSAVDGDMHLTVVKGEIMAENVECSGTISRKYAEQ